MIKSIPNLITLGNLASGCAGVVLAFNADLRWVSVTILISLLLDYLDGTAARLLKVKSELGKELDSLADVVSFGLVPALIAFIILQRMGMGDASYVAFLIALLSAYRLAKFNIDERQTDKFIGLPTPANAMIWASLPLILLESGISDVGDMVRSLFNNSYVIIAMVIGLSYLLIAELPLFALKFKNLKWQENQVRFIFLLLSLALILILSFYAIPFVILLYLIISIVTRKSSTS